MRQVVPRHLARHRWFYIALLCGALASYLSRGESAPVRIALTGDTFYLAYLSLVGALVVLRHDRQFLEWANDEDEGIFVIVVITVAAAIFSLTSLFSLVNAGGTRPDVWRMSLSLASAPLGWMTLQTVAALHYAHAYYVAADGPEGDGLRFPDTKTPGAWDFLYFSFVVGMTAQVSDVQVTTTAMRQLVLAHGFVSFVFNTVLIALTVNVVVALAQTPK
jgi:uncharacterized membrane protein